MSRKHEFDLAIKESLRYKENLNPYRKDQYYDDSYAKAIIEDYKKNNIRSLEVKYRNNNKCTPICAFASSGRLCYLHFRPQNAIFEVDLYNDLKRSTPSKFDARIENSFFECKCQEIVGKSHSSLSANYLKSNLFNEFHIENFTIRKKTISFDIEELKIKMEGKHEYTHLHFDLKQLLCHLMAIANNNREGKTKKLEYIFFTPNKELIEKNKTLTQIYRELEKEIGAIFAEGTTISDFAKKHNICIKKPKFIEIKDINDFVYENTYLNK